MTIGIYEEQQLWNQGAQLVAGVDEVGRGCWAGPVVAAAVMFPQHLLSDPSALAGINDSKTLSAEARQAMALRIRQLASGIGLGVVSAHLIDLFGIAVATKWAMMHAVLSLPALPDGLVIDWVKLPELPLLQRSLPKGDAVSISVAAASIVAKVYRDNLMHEYDQRDARYGWAAHKGYGTAQHQQALAAHGPTQLHRRSFKPLAAFVD
ncbi:ribonuclease HII [Herpetosiphon sp. NSE202]|uniref:ribonuclease HII n=1 Tax=Herpetosiphon sp. NSE202 TaxID=3351349 RepID=UPI003637222C